MSTPAGTATSTYWFVLAAAFATSCLFVESNRFTQLIQARRGEILSSIVYGENADASPFPYLESVFRLSGWYHSGWRHWPDPSSA